MKPQSFCQRDMAYPHKSEKSHSCKENDENNDEDCELKQASPVFEKKRTANLESLIGHIKVRKLNQSEPAGVHKASHKSSVSDYHTLYEFIFTIIW